MLVGDLGYAGLEGRVYVPAEGSNLPGVAFGHDWLKNVKAYHGTLRHLASWGIAVAAPNTERGFTSDHRGFAADLESCLQILAGVKLGTGNITVSPGKLGVVGHGMGAGCAVLTAVDNDVVKAVGAVYPADTSPSCYRAAQHVTCPGLVISGEDNFFDAGNPARLAGLWKGDAAYRELKKGRQGSFSEDTAFKLITGAGSLANRPRELVRGLLTGFLLHQLAGEKEYSAFSAADAEAKNITSIVGKELADKGTPLTG